MNETAPHPESEPPTGPVAEPVWGAPQPPNPTWSRKKTLATVAVAVVLGGCAGAAIYAAGNGSTDTGGPGGFGGPGAHLGAMGGEPGGAGPGGMRGFGSQQSTSLHARSVVSDGHGGYTTELTQTGKVTAVSDTSITAVSADDYAHTYVIDAKTLTSTGSRSGDGSPMIAVGDTAYITATASGDKTTATSVIAAGKNGEASTGGDGAEMPPAAGQLPPVAGRGGPFPGAVPPGEPPQGN
ncbi:hypothetical protein G4X40_07905 [Rhodococcus sp. D2-41]|uniref:hypothetical protein n=1 Tax=Speluncibacter jeojiensis TaxID=2710754 RepID=UPI00240F48D0|nr:hypothetical protein [Rhodococcus sp. D2-41]MDG3010072.1 hypothetical protein [Rhodococcus sp. D2-41]